MKYSHSRRPAPTGLLLDRLVGLAGTPDGDTRIETDLIVVAQLAAWLIADVDHASITSRDEGAYVTVAASSDLALAADQAQYTDNAGPCLEALEAEYPAFVPDTAAILTWPGFREVAARLELRTSLSIPIFVGSGRTIASLNLYSHRVDSLASLTAAVWGAYEADTTASWRDGPLDPGGRELAGGLIGALALRSMIHRAIGILVTDGDITADRAYRDLCEQADKADVSLTDVAARITEQDNRRPGTPSDHVCR